MEKMKMTSLLDIPGEVLTHDLFPLLEPNDIVRLRRVCKPLKLLADDHLRLKVRNNRILFIGKKCDSFNTDEEDENYMDPKLYNNEFISMKTLINMQFHLPVARVALNIDKWEWDMFLENEDGEWPMKEFLNKYGEQITEVKLCQLSVPLRKEKEIAFFEALPNLTRLSINVLVAKNPQKKNEDKDKILFPETFKKLNHFEILQFVFSEKKCVAEKEYFWKMVEQCPSLKVLVCPWFNEDYLTQETRASLTALGYQYLGHLLQNDRLPSLKYYDLALKEPSREEGPRTFADFCTVCLNCDVKLLNVSPQVFEGWDGDDLMGLENIGRSTVSLMDLCVECFMVPFPQLAKLKVHNYHSLLESWDRQTTWRQFGVPEWPKLRQIDVELDCHKELKKSKSKCKYFEIFEIIPYPDLPKDRDLFNILFEARRRPTVTHLRICTNEPTLEKRKTPTLPLRKVAWSCFNLRKVHFIRWSGTNKALSMFWEKLPLLEDVCIENSPVVGNSAFVGKDLEKPVFLELKNLKRLCLLNVQKMKKITDTAFKLVFRHMKIERFHLTSWDIDDGGDRYEIVKIKSITKEGIRSLLTSNFAKHIERFPFKSWMLDDMDEGEFHQLRDEFRSSQIH